MNADKTLLTPLCKRLGATLSRRGMLFVGLGIVYHHVCGRPARSLALPL